MTEHRVKASTWFGSSKLQLIQSLLQRHCSYLEPSENKFAFKCGIGSVLLLVADGENKQTKKAPLAIAVLTKQLQQVFSAFCPLGTAMSSSWLGKLTNEESTHYKTFFHSKMRLPYQKCFLFSGFTRDKTSRVRTN